MSKEADESNVDTPPEAGELVAVVEAAPSTIVEDGVEYLSTCPKCGRSHVPLHVKDGRLCVDCVKAYNNRIARLRNTNADWVAIAEENDIPLYLKQPQETQWEYTIWLAYRDSYPGKKPTYRDVAEQLNCSVDAVKKVGARWNFPMRMQAWISHCDEVTLVQRQQEIVDMNAANIALAAKMRQKVMSAIDYMVPSEMKPGEISTMVKTLADLENKARLNTIDVDAQRRESLAPAQNPNLKKVQTKKEDLSEVISVLAAAGVLDEVTKIGVRQNGDATEIVAETNNKIGE